MITDLISDLQLSLMAAGGVLIVGVISYNKWQEIKTRKSVERAFANNQDDVLMQPGQAGANGLRQEPNLVEDAAASEEEIAAAIPLAPVAQPQKPVELPIDKLIDCVIALNVENALRGDKILPVLQSFRHVGNKPVHYIGLRVKGDWEPVAHGGLYSALKVGVQMASRSTALNELEYSELVTRLRQVADSIGAEPDIPDMMDVMARARSLHQFVAEHDAQLGINLASNGAP
ncbi:MAG: cell division protein, partial [Burkholderiales bacterium]|nr:cell division protein [Burkholderiales bacterium]